MSSSSIRDALERAKLVFAERPAVARKANASATAVLVGGLRCDITGPEGEHATSDMPKPMGGEASGPNPGWFLRASMASCAATAIAMRAAVLGIAIERLEVGVHSESDARGLLGMDDVSAALSNMRMDVKIGAKGATAQQLKELVEWAEAHSPVSCTLRNGPPQIAIGIHVT
jgi:uncharacterized OsmC-like protein